MQAREASNTNRALIPCSSQARQFSPGQDDVLGHSIAIATDNVAKFY